MTETPAFDTDEWASFVVRMNEEVLDAYEQSLEAQGEFLDAWTDALEDSVDDLDGMDGLEGYAKAYEIWMDAAETQLELASDSLQSGDVDVQEFRDVWLTTANQGSRTSWGRPRSRHFGSTTDRVVRNTDLPVVV